MNSDQLSHQDRNELNEIDAGMSAREFENYQQDMRELHDEGFFDEDAPRDDNDFRDDMDGDHASALASAGFGTDEDYEHCDIDAAYEDRFDFGD